MTTINWQYLITAVDNDARALAPTDNTQVVSGTHTHNGSGSSVVVSLPANTNLTANASPTGTVRAIATLVFNTDGTITRVGNTVVNRWASPTTPGIGSDYEIRFSNFTVVEGTPENITTSMNSWQLLSTDRGCTVRGPNDEGYDVSRATLFVEIRQAGGAVVTSSTINILVEKT